jgi:ribonuclease PH
MDGDLSIKEFNEGFDMILESAKEIYEIQKNALMEKQK